MTPDQYCQDKAAKSGSSFYYSFRFLPEPQRSAIIALYAFCREVDDVVDEGTDAQIARRKLAWWREEIQRLFAGQPTHPVTKALQGPIQRHQIPAEHLLEVIDGMEMDLDFDTYPSFKELSLYCHRVASIVGLMSAEIFGFENRQTLRYAHDLGMAFQLTNLIRDVREDAMRGRVYLPQDELTRFNVRNEDLSKNQTSPAVIDLLKFQTARARQYYESAFNQLPDEDRFRQRSGIIMAEIYQATLTEIENDGFRVLEHRVSLTPLRKLWLAWTIARREKSRYRRDSKRHLA